MDIALTSALLHVAATQTQRETADAVQVSVLKKAMQSQEATALALLETVPQAPRPVSDGSLGTQLDTYA